MGFNQIKTSETLLKDLSNIKLLETEERFEIGLRWLGDILVNAEDFANMSE